MPIEKLPDPKRYHWMLGISLGLIVSGWLAGLLAGDWGLTAGGILLVAAFVLAAISLSTALRIHIRRKALPILLMVLSGLPVCCITAGGAFSTAYDLVSGKPDAFTPRPQVEWDASPSAVILQAARPIHSYHPSLSSDVTRNYIPEGRLFGDGRAVSAGPGHADRRANQPGNASGMEPGAASPRPGESRGWHRCGGSDPQGSLGSGQPEPAWPASGEDQ